MNSVLLTVNIIIIIIFIYLFFNTNIIIFILFMFAITGPAGEKLLVKCVSDMIQGSDN